MLICLLPLAYLYYIYPSLPAIVPTHFGKGGRPDGFGPKIDLFAIEGIMGGVGILVYLLLRFLPAIDPKKKVKFGEPVFSKMALGIAIFLTAVGIIILYAVQHKDIHIDKVMLTMAGLLFTFIGNLMYNIKPNYFAGVRTPWTLEDDATWRATHRVAGKLWFVGGIVLTIITLLVTGIAATVIFMVILAVLVIIPVAFSYVYYKGHHRADNNNVT